MRRFSDAMGLFLVKRMLRRRLGVEACVHLEDIVMEISPNEKISGDEKREWVKRRLYDEMPVDGVERDLDLAIQVILEDRL